MSARPGVVVIDVADVLREIEHNRHLELTAATDGVPHPLDVTDDAEIRNGSDREALERYAGPETERYAA